MVERGAVRQRACRGGLLLPGADVEEEGSASSRNCMDDDDDDTVEACTTDCPEAGSMTESSGACVGGDERAGRGEGFGVSEIGTDTLVVDGVLVRA
mmetsp:Transcript_922/g.2609  ORF Transcript_922/g.2609 Transcript_922/m.2609 type:complete len:96 (+) Transcript_922:1021-1308(+)